MAETTRPDAVEALEPTRHATTARPRQSNRKKLPVRSSSQHVDLAAYADWSREQGKRACADQATGFFNRYRKATNGERSVETQRLVDPSETPSGVNWSYPRQSIFFSDGPPYTAGTPDPEFATRTNGTAKGAYYNIESYADAERGRLSVGVSGGVWRNADWSGGTFYSELPDRWLLGDAITASASILQVIDLPSTIPQGATVTAAAQFSWLPMYRDNWGAPYGGYIYNALQNIPGLHSAIGNGFVGVSVVASTRVSLFAGPTMAVSSETTLPVLLMAIDADSYGDVPDQVPAPYLFFDFAFAGNPWAIEELAVTVPTVNDGTHIIVDTTVRLMGARCGVNDPDGGSVAAAFQDLYDPASPVSDVPTSPNPFVVNRITAWSTSD